MGDAQIDPRQELELEKLRLEIVRLQRSWWREPSYISAVFPTLIALLSLVAVWRTGLLDAKAVSLDTRRTLLQADVKEFESRRDQLSLLNSRLELRSKELEERNATLAGRANTLVAELSRLKDEQGRLVSRADSLAAQNRVLQTASLSLQSEVKNERRRADLIPLTQFVADLRAGTREGVGSSGVVVIRRLRDNPALHKAYTDEALEYVRVIPEAEVAALIIQVVALGTDDEMLKNRLFDAVQEWLACNYSTSISPTLISALDDYDIEQETGVRWSEVDRLRILSILIDAIGRQGSTPEIRQYGYAVAGSLQRHVSAAARREHAPLYQRFIDIARRSANDNSVSILERRAATWLIRECSAEAFLVVVSELCTNVPADGQMLREVELLLRGTPKASLKDESGTVLTFPGSAAATDWQNWRAQYVDLVAKWRNGSR
jgi:hypothetical protein